MFFRVRVLSCISWIAFVFYVQSDPRNTRKDKKRDSTLTTQLFDNTLIIASWIKPLLASVFGL